MGFFIAIGGHCQFSTRGSTGGDFIYHNAVKIDPIRATNLNSPMVGCDRRPWKAVSKNDFFLIEIKSGFPFWMQLNIGCCVLGKIIVYISRNWWFSLHLTQVTRLKIHFIYIIAPLVDKMINSLRTTYVFEVWVHLPEYAPLGITI